MQLEENVPASQVLAPMIERVIGFLAALRG